VYSGSSEAGMAVVKPHHNDWSGKAQG
jgi:hypothetical protein